MIVCLCGACVALYGTLLTSGDVCRHCVAQDAGWASKWLLVEEISATLRTSLYLSSQYISGADTSASTLFFEVAKLSSVRPCVARGAVVHVVQSHWRPCVQHCRSTCRCC